MALAFENIRLKELAIVADLNLKYYKEFLVYLGNEKYDSLYDFIKEEDNEKTEITILNYFNSFKHGSNLYDGVARPYKENYAKWLFLSWILRDAPVQRLTPMLASISSLLGTTPNHRKAKLLTLVKQPLISIYPNQESWTWYCFREVMIDRLEGSRRSIKGSLFEVIVRRHLREVFEENNIELSVQDKEIKIGGETYDIIVENKDNKKILMPVKTRETMGGGHALLFTRDIYKSISLAQVAGHKCIPVVIAESWGGDIDALKATSSIVIARNPNQIDVIEPILRDEIIKNVDVFRALAKE